MMMESSAFPAAAQWIGAPDALLAAIPVIHDPLFPEAPYLCGKMYIRQHLRRIVELEELPVSAEASFTCDNRFDLFCNGQAVVSQQSSSGRLELRPWLRPGRNLLLLRLYHTASPDHFTLAVTGGIRMVFGDGTTREILTDDSFEPLWLATFFAREEPEDFLTNPECGRPIRRYSGLWHPRAARRSLLLRRRFEVRPVVALRRAVLAATANCMACFSLNGEPLDDGVLQPGATEKRREYREYELTSRLRPGENVLGAITGNGWTNCASWGTLHCHRNGVIAALRLEYADGQCQELVTDGAWQVALSPLTENDLQFGERYDARLELPGWDCPGTASQGASAAGRWVSAAPLPPEEVAVIPPLVRQSYPPIRPVAAWHPRFLRELPPGAFPALDTGTRAWLYDAGRNAAGSLRMTLRGMPAGQRIGFYFCERLRDNGNPETMTYGATVYPQDTEPNGIAPFLLRGYSQYITAGRPVEEYATRFTYTGFRYVVVTGTAAPLPDGDLEALELHNDLALVGEFHCGSPALNRIWECTRRTWLSNCHNGPTDCPTREKNFWNGDTQIFAHAACWISDNREFLGNWTRYGRKMEPGVYGWEDETYVLPYVLYRFYGDRTVLEDCFEAMMELVERRRESPDMLLPEEPRSPYNDWLNPTGVNLTPQFFAGCWYVRMLDQVSEIADILGRTEVGAQLRARAAASRQEFLRRHFDAASCRFDEDIQCAYVLGLAFNIIPQELRGRCAAHLAEQVETTGYQTTGFQGTRHLLQCLAQEAGRPDLALMLLERQEFPSWLDMLKGLDTIPESWYGNRDPDGSVSMCHFSYGSCVAWFFEYLGGFDLRQSAPGLGELVLTPHALPQLGSCEVRYRTPWGEVRTAWHFQDGQPVYEYTAPPEIKVTWRPGV